MACDHASAKAANINHVLTASARKTSNSGSGGAYQARGVISGKIVTMGINGNNPQQA